MPKEPKVPEYQFIEDLFNLVIDTAYKMVAGAMDVVVALFCAADDPDQDHPPAK